MSGGVEFSLEQSTLKLNGFTITGWSNDTDALTFPTIDFAKAVFGADGKMVLTSTGQKGGPVTIKLLPNSPAVKFFQNLITLKQTTGVITPFAGTFLSNVGVLTTLIGGGLTNGPLATSMGMGETKNHDYVITFEQVISEYVTATF